MDAAAKKWIQEYKKLFDQVAAKNAGMNVAEDVNASDKVLKVLGRVVDDENTSSATQVPKKVIKKIGKLVPEDKKNASGTKVQDSGERDALPDGLTNVDPTSVTEEEVKILLERSAKKQYKDSTYVPVRVNTPQILIEVAQSYGEKIDNLPVVMQVEKVRQAMSTQEQWQSEGKTSRAHELSSDEIISIIKAMNTPQYIVYQTDNDRYVEIVKYKAKGSEAVAVIEIGEDKNPAALNGYRGGKYQVLITAFNPDENTIDSILNKKSNRILYPKKKKGSSQRGPGNNVPSHLNDSPFAISILHKSQNSNTSDKNSSKDFDSGERFALADGKRATAGEVAAVKSSISKKGIDSKGIIAIADKYFARYSGQLTRTGVRYEFLAAADMLFDLTAESGDRAYASVEALAEELVTNEKDTSGMTEDIKEMKRHIREITFEVRERDKGEFDSVGGYGQFRKDNFGTLKLANEGASVDSVYAELQNLYGTSYFPELNTVGEMLIRIAEVMNMEPDLRTETDAELEVIKYETAVSIMGELADAFNVKIPEKSKRLSKSDAEAFKKRANAKAETKAAKEIARAKKRLEQIESKMRTKLRAEYETDRVFSESGVKKRLATIDGYKALPASERSDVESRIWTELNESDGYNEREWIGLNWTTKLTDRLVNQKGEGVSRSEREIIFNQVNDTIEAMAQSGRKSVRASMEGEIRAEIETKTKAQENAKINIRTEIYQSLKKITDMKTARFAAASEYKDDN